MASFSKSDDQVLFLPTGRCQFKVVYPKKRRLYSLYRWLFFGFSLVALLSVSRRTDNSDIRVFLKTIVFKNKKYSLDLYKPSELFSQRPAIILVPEFWGKDALEDGPARLLTSMGYVVLVLDVYGNGKHTMDVNKVFQIQRDAEKKGTESLLSLISTAIEFLKKDANVDPQRIAGIGFGYGGGLLLNLVKQSSTQELKAVVSFYGGIKNASVSRHQGTSPALLYIRPENDVYTSEAQFDSFVEQLKKTNSDFEVVHAKAAHYGFIHRSIASYGPGQSTFMYYEPKQTKLAWQSTYRFLAQKLQ